MDRLNRYLQIVLEDPYWLKKVFMAVVEHLSGQERPQRSGVRDFYEVVREQRYLWKSDELATYEVFREIFEIDLGEIHSWRYLIKGTREEYHVWGQQLLYDVAADIIALCESNAHKQKRVVCPSGENRKVDIERLSGYLELVLDNPRWLKAVVIAMINYLQGEERPPKAGVRDFYKAVREKYYLGQSPDSATYEVFRHLVEIGLGEISGWRYLVKGTPEEYQVWGRKILYDVAADIIGLCVGKAHKQKQVVRR